jgi:hypothetical protein
MGHTHYWAYQPDSDQFQAAFAPLAEDARLILTHLANQGVKTAGPSGARDPLLSGPVIAFNGLTPAAADAFVLSAVGSGLTQHTADGQKFHLDFCKTSREPYDVAVTSILLRAHQLAPWHLTLASDESWDGQWRAARDLLTELFGGAPAGDVLHSLAYVSRGPQVLHPEAQVLAL